MAKVTNPLHSQKVSGSIGKKKRKKPKKTYTDPAQAQAAGNKAAKKKPKLNDPDLIFRQMDKKLSIPLTPAEKKAYNELTGKDPKPPKAPNKTTSAYRLTKPANPQSAKQFRVQNRSAVANRIISQARQMKQKRHNYTRTDLEELKLKCPAGKRWNDWLMSIILASGGNRYDQWREYWSRLSPFEMAAWHNASATLTPRIGIIPQKPETDGGTPPVLNGEVWYLYHYALYWAGVGSAPGSNPPAYS